MTPRKSTMKRKNRKMLRGGIFGFDVSAMMGLKPKDTKIAPKVGATLSGQPGQPGQPSLQPSVQLSGQPSVQPSGQPSVQPSGKPKLTGGKKRKTQKSKKSKKSKSQKKR